MNTSLLYPQFWYGCDSFECTSCGKMFPLPKMLLEHVDHEQAEEASRTSLMLQFVADTSNWIYANCSSRGKRFQSERDI